MNEANIDRIKKPENRLPPQANKSRFVMEDADLKKKKKSTYDDYGGTYEEEQEQKEDKPQQMDFFGISQEISQIKKEEPNNSVIGNVNWDFDASNQPPKAEPTKTFDFDSY